LLALVVLGHAAAAQDNRVSRTLAGLDTLYPEVEKLYIDLHQNPELSLQEEKTAAKLAARLVALGYTVTEKVGGHGIVAVLANGKGPTLLVRADLDGLPVEEKTGLPYASRVKATDDKGNTVSVMHACGHDVHMSALVGAATLLAKAREQWKGTLVLIGQPAEEKGGGAAAMLKDGLFTRFPRPDNAIAFHDSGDLPAGKVGYVSGFALANVDSVDVTIYGKGGHGAYPHQTVDPVVLAARTIVSLQTLVSRENNPFDPAVVTVGSIHGGTKHNIVSDEVKLQLTVRSYKDDVRKRLLSGIERIAKGEAAAAGAPKPPLVAVVESTPATYNDPGLTKTVASALRRQFGEGNVVETPPVMGGEDFSEYGRAGVPAVIFWVGAQEPKRFEEARATGVPAPSIHSPQFAPDRERTLRTGVTALTVTALELLGKP